MIYRRMQSFCPCCIPLSRSLFCRLKPFFMSELCWMGIIGFENEMSRSVSTCSQMAFHMVTVRLFQSFGVMECRRNAVSKSKDYWDCVIDISIPQTQFCRISFLIIHFACNSSLSNSPFLEIIPNPIRISFSVWLRFDVNVMWSRSIHAE